MSGPGLSESRIDEESAAFHERVRRGYRALAEGDPDRFIVIDGRGAIRAGGIGNKGGAARPCLIIITGTGTYRPRSKA